MRQDHIAEIMMADIGLDIRADIGPSRLKLIPFSLDAYTAFIFVDQGNTAAFLCKIAPWRWQTSKRAFCQLVLVWVSRLI